MSDSIIVYRNPMEKAMWEGIMNADFPYLFWFGVGIGIFVGWVYAIDALMQKIVPYRMRNQFWATWLMLGSASALTFLSCWVVNWILF